MMLGIPESHPGHLPSRPLLATFSTPRLRRPSLHTWALHRGASPGQVRGAAGKRKLAVGLGLADLGASRVHQCPGTGLDASCAGSPFGESREEMAFRNNSLKGQATLERVDPRIFLEVSASVALLRRTEKEKESAIAVPWWSSG